MEQPLPPSACRQSTCTHVKEPEVADQTASDGFSQNFPLLFAMICRQSSTKLLTFRSVFLLMAVRKPDAISIKLEMIEFVRWPLKRFLVIPF
jgi:hypothetical protein